MRALKGKAYLTERKKRIRILFQKLFYLFGSETIRVLRVVLLRKRKKK